MNVGDVTHWMWWAVDERGAVLDVFLQKYRDTEAARPLSQRLLEGFDVPEVMHTDTLWSDGAAVRESPPAATI